MQIQLSLFSGEPEQTEAYIILGAHAIQRTGDWRSTVDMLLIKANDWQQDAETMRFLVWKKKELQQSKLLCVIPPDLQHSPHYPKPLPRFTHAVVQKGTKVKSSKVQPQSYNEDI